ncbi:MAG: DUF6249 domain-containing protein [Woeseiaceae bacterium]|nr:DUF6249 domain-containing protein [Woeseiaceae bacterium]
MESGIFGLAAFGFWLFIGAATVAGIWDGIRKREAQHETLRRMIEAGKQPDQQFVNKLLGTDKNTSRDLTTGGLITFSVAPGLALMGYLIDQGAFMPLLGVAGLIACIGLGLLVAAQFVKRSENKDTEFPPLG